LNILYVSPEIAPFAKTGGLADVARALPPAVKALGHEIRTVMPKYFTLNEGNAAFERKTAFTVPMFNGLHSAVLRETRANGSVTYLIENEEYFLRDGFYGTSDGDYPDNLERFVFFCKAALEACRAVGFRPDVIHCNDWQTAALPALLKLVYRMYRKDPFFDPAPKTVYSIHNISYQGRFPEDHWSILSLPKSYYTYDFEFYGSINLTKSAIHFADAITTVSETYAREIRETEFGYGLQGSLENRKSDLYGILNGVDYEEWSPEVDPHTYGIHYSPEDLSGKRAIRSRLRAEFGLPDPKEVPLIGMVARFVQQKGIDLLAETARRILNLNTQLILLGSGEPEYHDFLEGLRRAFPDRVGLYLGFNNGLAHKIEAGSDIFLMPSHFEPCGLNQIYSLRYGALPVVRLTGGLADTIRDGENGFTFPDFNAFQFFDAVRRAVEIFRDRPEKWKQMMQKAMKEDYSWKQSAEEYIRVYEKTLTPALRI
jgi:starch synthase